METMHSVFKNIWLADDDEDDQSIFESALKEISSLVNLTTFSDSKALLAELEKLQPDLLFLDINMPCLDGNKCLKVIRDNPSWDRMPVVMYSASSYSKDVKASYAFGATLYLVKPSSYKGLIKVLQKILQLDWSNLSSITDDQYVGNRFVPFRAE